MGILSAKSTPIPNEVLDRMGGMSSAELKVITAICCKTAEEGSPVVTLSTAEILSMTGLSRTSAWAAVSQLVEKDYIDRVRINSGYKYRLILGADKDAPQGWGDATPRQTSGRKQREGQLASDKWRKLRRQVFYRDKYTCQYCGGKSQELHCDHVIPLSQGGSNDIANLVTACHSCNLEKGAQTPDEWLGNN